MDTQQVTELLADSLDEKKNVDAQRFAYAVRQRQLNKKLIAQVAKITVHGPQNVSGSYQWSEKIRWAAVMLVSLIGLVLHTANQVQVYLANPVSSTVTQATNRFVMPDVTVCDPLLNKFFSHSLSDYDKMIGANGAILQHTKELQLIFSHLFGWESPEFLKALYTSLEHRVNMSAVGAKLQDFVIGCWYRGKPCNNSDFVTFFHRRFGNCFTYQPKRRQLSGESSDDGLVLVLYSPSTDDNFPLDRIMKTITGLESQGFRIAIHQQNTQPQPDTAGIFVQTGTRLDLPLLQSVISLVNTRSKPCSQPSLQQYWDEMLKRNFSYADGLFDCLATERDRAVQTRCGCTMEGLVPIKSESDSPNPRHFCHDIFEFRSQLTLSQRRKVRTDMLTSTQLFMQQLGIIYRTFGSLPFSRVQPIVHKFAARVIRQHPDLELNSQQLLCALMPTLASSHTRCHSLCHSEQYVHSASQSAWPVQDMQVRGASIQVGKLSQLLHEFAEATQMLQPQPALLRSVQAMDFSLLNCTELAQDSNAIPKKQRRRLKQLRESCKPLQTFIRRHMSQVRIFAQSLNVQVLSEERSYTAISLLSDLGGISGLWIGASVVSIFELFELMYFSVTLLALRLQYLLPDFHPSAADANHLQQQQQQQRQLLRNNVMALNEQEEEEGEGQPMWRMAQLQSMANHRLPNASCEQRDFTVSTV